MPNHVHAIVIIDKPNDGRGNDMDGGITGNKNPMLHDNISRILNWYTGRVTFESRKIHAGFAWQSRFHDRIIRNDAEYQRKKNYIINNPQNWKGDTFHNG